MDSCPSATTEPDTRFSVAMVSRVTWVTWTATPAEVWGWEASASSPPWQAVRVRAAARAAAAERMR